MRILLVHNRYQNAGGEDTVFAAEAELLRSRGHVVDEYVDDNQRVNTLQPVSLAANTVWSHASYRRLRHRLMAFRPNVVHVHNTFVLISPSVYHACRTAGVPVVQTLHNYRLLCPGALLYRNGQVCEDCLGRAIPWPGVLHGCYRSSRAQTAVVMAMLAFHRALRTWTKRVHTYIALTEQARQRFVAGGLPANRIVVKPNFVHPDPGPGPHGDGYALFVGRLSAEKGLRTVLRAWHDHRPPVPLKIAGEGPLAGEVAAAAERCRQVEWLGPRCRSQVLRLMQQARFLLFPSELYENFPMVIVEAYAAGLPIIAANQGAAAHLVEHGRTGLHFQVGDAADLAAQVRWSLQHPHELAAMSRRARSEFARKYSAESNYRQLLDIYAVAVATGRRLP